MKNKRVFVKELRSVLIPFVVLTIFIAALFQSCQSKEDENLQNVPQLKAGSITGKTTEIYFGHEIFTRDAGKPVVVKKKIGNLSLIRFKPDDFILHITNGDGKTNLVSAAIIKVDGQIVFNTSDFSKKTVTLTKGLTALTDNSELEVELRSDPGSFIDLWIEGTLKPLINCDIDGNVYNMVTIGTQIWMAENLRTTKYNDGTAITLAADPIAWSNLTTPGYCWYKNDEATYKNPYGAIYNWYTVNTGKLCPTGWHVPTDAEWTTLVTYCGGRDVAGGELKETGTSHWLTNADATNSTGFSAVGGGTRYYESTFSYIGAIGYWWSSTESDANNAWYWYIGCSNSTMPRHYYTKRNGFSVRCLKD